MKTTKMKCKFCDYEWKTRSQMKNVSCPSCLNKNHNLNKEVTKNENNKMANLENPKQNSRFNSKISDNLKQKESKGNSKELPEPLILEKGD